MPMPKEYTSHGKSNYKMLAIFFLFWQNQKFMKPATYGWVVVLFLCFCALKLKDNIDLGK